MRFALVLALSLVFLSCQSHSVEQTEIDLVRNLHLAEQQPDTALIPFGTEEGKPSLISGWSNPEKDHGNPFQWAVARDPSFAFSAQANGRSLNLYLVLKSFFSNPAEVYVNDHHISHIDVEDQTSRHFLPLPAAVVNAEKNVVKLQFTELRSPQNGRDKRQLAAAAYLAVITPSKYIGDVEPGARMIDSSGIRIRNKIYPALTFQTGGSVNYFEKLSNASILSFGYHFRPASYAEDDDFAMFRVSLLKDGAKAESIFYRRLQKGSNEFLSLPLSKYMGSDEAGIYEIRFEIERNSIFNDAETAWIHPVLRTAQPWKQSRTDASVAAATQNQSSGGNVLLIVLDAGGASHFHCYGYARNTTPVVDRLAGEGIQFQSAYSNAAYTLASTASLMSGFYPEHHRILSMRDKLPQSITTLAEVFRGAGYRTATFVANGNASGTFGMTQGFDKVAEVFREPNYSGWGKEITEHFTKWLNNNRSGRFFVYLHFREPHDPYNPPEEWVRKFTDPDYSGSIGKTFENRIRINTNDAALTAADRKQIADLYDANLAYGDSQVGEVLQALKRAGLYDNTIVIVTADHGEAFWQHGYQGHNTQVYEESIHIPLVIKMRNGLHAGQKVAQRVRTIDLYPTLMQLLNLPSRHSRLDGESYLPYIISPDDQKREVIAQTTRERQYAYRENQFKFIDDLVYDVWELYDLQKDPEEKHNLMSEQNIRAKYYRSKLLSYIATNRALAAGNAERAVIDEAARENLRALGYIDSDKKQ
jgi:arylsulfatase A-like enzyme